MAASPTLAWRRPSRPALLAEAWLLLLRIRVALWLLPWRRVLALLPADVASSSTVPIERLERAIRVASRLVPRATCLAQALALNHLLSRRGYASCVRIGVANAQGRFTAHAWVECGGITLLRSAAGGERYTPLLAWTPAHPDLFQ
jgi:hypothetical protein